MKKTGCVILALLLFLSAFAAFPASADAVIKNSFANQFNVVFVNDESGSMYKENDKDGYRYEAVQRFVALMTKSGNRMGSVSFNEKILDRTPLKEVNGFADKITFINHMKEFSPDKTGDTAGMTNIGLALKTAVELLDAGRDPALPSIILLMTDGETKLDSDEKMQVSLAQKADAVDAASKAGYQVYSIGLGRGGHEEELKQISDYTGGKFSAVAKAEDLKSMEMLFYEMIFNTISGSPQSKIAVAGLTTFTWDVAGSGVEEMNVVIDGRSTSCELIDPGSATYSGSLLDGCSIVGETSRLIKITQPREGKWVLNVHAPIGTAISVMPLYNASYSLRTFVSGNARIGQTLTFTAQLCDKNGPISDLAQYRKFTASLLCKRGGNTLAPMQMELGTEGFTCLLPIEEEGTLEASISVSKGLISAVSEEAYSFDIRNSAPLPKESSVRLRPFVFLGLKFANTFSLADFVTDAEGQTLCFDAASAEFSGADDLSTGDGILRINHFPAKNGCITVTASDPMGASCTFDVQVEAVDLFLWFLLALLLALAVFVTVKVVSLNKQSLIPFSGSVELRTHIGKIESSPVVRTPAQLATGAVYIDDCWGMKELKNLIPAHSRLVVDPKDDGAIYLKTTRPVFVQFGWKKIGLFRGKTYRIQTGQTVDVYLATPNERITLCYREDARE